MQRQHGAQLVERVAIHQLGVVNEFRYFHILYLILYLTSYFLPLTSILPVRHSGIKYLFADTLTHL